jgi:hypothetical protein
MTKIYTIVKETYDHTRPAPAGCFSEDGELVSREVVKAYFSKEKRDEEFSKPELYTNTHDGVPIDELEGPCFDAYDESEEFTKEEFEMSEEHPAVDILRSISRIADQEDRTYSNELLDAILAHCNDYFLKVIMKFGKE